MPNFKKIAADRAERAKSLYSLEVGEPEDDALYSRICFECRMQKEPLDTVQKKKLGLSLTEMAWKCPECGEVTEAHGAIDLQTDGFAEMNNEVVPGASIEKDDEDGDYKDIESIKADSEKKIRE